MIIQLDGVKVDEVAGGQINLISGIPTFNIDVTLYTDKPIRSLVVVAPQLINIITKPTEVTVA